MKFYRIAALGSAILMSFMLFIVGLPLNIAILLWVLNLVVACTNYAYGSEVWIDRLLKRGE